jgi:phosphoenolpyruvate synthase/pyruvate phosphate dikinase
MIRQIRLARGTLTLLILRVVLWMLYMFQEFGESGFKNSAQLLIQDEFIVYKPNLNMGVNSIIQKKLGTKSHMMVYKDIGDTTSLIEKETSSGLRGKFILNDEEILTIANWGIILENYYDSPMSMEWAKDSSSQDLFLLQAKPESFKKLKSY